MFRNSHSVGLMLWAGLVMAASYGLAKDVTTWRPVADERALAVRVGDPVPDPDPITVDTTKCCTPSAFNSCTDNAWFWPCAETVTLICNSPPVDDPYVFAKYGKCTHTPGQDGGEADAVCQDPDPAMDYPRCTNDAGKPSINFKVDRCTPTGLKEPCDTGGSRCGYTHTPAGTGDNTATHTVLACTNNDTFCPQIDPNFTRCQNPNAAVPQD